MESKFENKCTYTYDYYLQLKKKTMDKGFVITGYVLAAIFIVIGALFVYWKWYTGIIFPILLIGLMLYRVIGIPIKLASFSAKKNREIHGKDIETTVSFYDDHFLAVNKMSGGKTNIKYVDVLKLLETKDLYILVMEQGLSIMLDRNGFSKGTREDFVEFIKKECVNAEDNI